MGDRLVGCPEFVCCPGLLQVSAEKSCLAQIYGVTKVNNQNHELLPPYKYNLLRPLRPLLILHLFAIAVSHPYARVAFAFLLVH